MNPKGKSYVCILHEYVQHALKKQPKYVFKEVGEYCIRVVLFDLYSLLFSCFIYILSGFIVLFIFCLPLRVLCSLVFMFVFVYLFIHLFVYCILPCTYLCIGLFFYFHI